jgi:predicted acyltransferase
MKTAERSLALDAMRGMTLAAMILVNTPGSWGYLYPPLAHADWHGYTPTDLIFPFFLFIVGAAMYFALRRFDYKPSREALFKLGKRVAIIFAIGLFLHAFPFNTPLGELRIMGVLQRIALAYGLATLAVYYVPGRLLYLLMAIILLGYWAMLYLVGTNNAFSVESNIVTVVDKAILGSDHLWRGKGVPFDPEGLLSTLPATVNVLVGFVATRLMMQTGNLNRRLIRLMVGGIALLGAGYLWSLWLPINKSLWTSSFVLVTSGWALLVLAAFVALCRSEVGTKLAHPLRIYGMNPLFIYALSILWVSCYFLIGLEYAGQPVNAYEYLYRLCLAMVKDPYAASVVFAGAHVLIFWGLAYILFRRGIFIKI